MKTIFYILLGFAFIIDCNEAFPQTTAGQVEQTVKAKPLSIGNVTFQKAVIVNGKQIITDADFKTLQAAAKIDSGKTCNQYNVVPLSTATARQPKTIIDKILDGLGL
jgi:hypothetical protein